MENLRHIAIDVLEQTLTDWGEPKFRIKQIKEWIWQKNIGSIEEMTNISKELRNKLHELFFIPKVSIDHSQFSEDGTVKSRFRLHDNRFVEGVMIPTEKRMTACVSSQVGCSLSCKFCATGYMKRMRNLEWDEIVDEVTLLNEQSQKHFQKNLSNIVFMGMGEPLLNYKNMMKAIERITSPEGLGMSPRRITVSTAGVAKMIRQLGDDEVRFKLALSLHAANDTKRNEIMPINESNDLKTLIEALNYFYQKTKSEITLEYILFADFNDSLADAAELVKVFRQIPADLVNIIEYNPIEMADFKKPNEAVTDQFMAYLAKHKVNARLRRSRGKDIDAACGQLANVDQAAQ
ncbi:23S rRNA (adenine(2503)-C(2))-methyltransferase RlmN [Taibaiella sp. KBW10]|uniref:23S rRNA (adenine(2503)-C(2))-methyltransferase RlmN n=1 Tax=Taibaiella sp. KBW10 TaxID=2153357 RepID=UPI000F5B5C66|nr:23S rRNA (adenine(2503)-C(2))-methyltransferase RlmN [Taibaiella sp. KBW10]RQO32618.1 23S rRNA (adenine(2503)-C(2))-methyltransferase RlmN [Taibaiella sp. KBW10]